MPVTKPITRGLTRALTRPIVGLGLGYLLRAEFGNAESAPIASPHNADVGQLTLVQTDGNFGISSGRMDVNGQSTPTEGDLGWYATTSIARKLGRIYKLKLSKDTTTANGFGFGWSTTQVAHITGAESEAFKIISTADIRLVDSGNVTRILGDQYAATTDYEFASILRTTGAFFFVKGGAFTNWTLLYVTAVGNTSALFPIFMDAGIEDGDIDHARVPGLLWYPVPITSDSFDRANASSLGSTDGLGAASDELGGGGLAWGELVGTFEINSNRARPTGSAPATQWKAVVESNKADIFAKATLNVATGGTAGIIFRHTDDDNYLYARIKEDTNQFFLSKNDGGSFSDIDTVAMTINASTDYELTLAASGSTINAWIDGGNNASATETHNQTATEHGILFDTVTGSQIDNWAVWDRTQSNFPNV